jgi:hypothetical protein
MIKVFNVYLDDGVRCSLDFLIICVVQRLGDHLCPYDNLTWVQTNTIFYLSSSSFQMIVQMMDTSCSEILSFC